MSAFMAWVLVGVLWLELSVLLSLVVGLIFRINTVLDELEAERRRRRFHHEDEP